MSIQILFNGRMRPAGGLRHRPLGGVLPRVALCMVMGLGLAGGAGLGSSAVAQPAGPACKLLDQAVFAPQGQTVARIARGAGLAREAPANAAGRADSMVIFRARMRVNTDGAPNSYHATDLAGESQAINHVCNAVGVFSADTGRQLGCAQALPVIRQWVRDGWVVPHGYRLSWENVLAAVGPAGHHRPCVFEDGPFAGYLGSMTSLRNGMTGPAAGECQVRDQVDPRFVPTIVMPSGDNPLKAFGAMLGDLVLVTNPATGATVSALIADVGPPDNLGEGSVALNMALLGVARQPRNHQDAHHLDTGAQAMMVAIFPGSHSFQVARPYTADNVHARVLALVRASGYAGVEALRDQLAACGSLLPAVAKSASPGR